MEKGVLGYKKDEDKDKEEEDKAKKRQKEKEEEEEKKREAERLEKAIEKLTQDFIDNKGKITDKAVDIRDKAQSQLETTQNKLLQDPNNPALLEKQGALLETLDMSSDILRSTNKELKQINSLRNDYGLESSGIKNLPTNEELNAFDKNIDTQLNAAKQGQNGVYKEMSASSNEYEAPSWAKPHATPTPEPTPKAAAAKEELDAGYHTPGLR